MDTVRLLMRRSGLALLLGLLVLTLTGGRLWAAEGQGGGAKGGEQKAEGGQSAANKEGGKKEDPKQVLTAEIEIDPMQINLAIPDRRRLHFNLLVTLTREIPISEVKRYQARIMDAIVLEFSDKSWTYLSEPESKIELRAAVINRVNRSIGKTILADMFFPAFLIY